MGPRLRRALLRLSPRAAAAAIVAASVGGSFGAWLVMFRLFYDRRDPRFWRGTSISTVVPLLVSGPVATLIVTLAHEAEAARKDAEHVAAHDGLTALPNRRRFEELAAVPVRLAADRRYPVSVALLDLDDFKQINDRHGHAAGDAVLRAVADVCRTTVRASDVVARWGGEEFALLLPGLDDPGAIAVLERLRAAVATLRPEGVEQIRCTVSIGVATCPPGAGLEDVMKLADAALYEAKSRGKDQVVGYQG